MRVRVISVLLLLIALRAVTGAQGRSVVVFPNAGAIKLSTGIYRATLCQGLCPVLVNSAGKLELIATANGRTLCAAGDMPGVLFVASTLTPRAQAKVLIHEVVHVALTCDSRDLPIDERIAQAMADLLDSDLGVFVQENLK